jgi:hypothetical protein
VEMYNCS